jgi:hypothetical protein
MVILFSDSGNGSLAGLAVNKLMMMSHMIGPRCLLGVVDIGLPFQAGFVGSGK